MGVHMAAPSQTRGQAILAGICVLATLIMILVLNARSGWDAQPQWLLWAPLVAGVELLPVPTWRGMTLSVGFPLLMMIAILYPPGAAGAIAFIGASDPRELRREVSLATALFNRSQVALSVMAAGTVFHVFQPPHQLLDQSKIIVLIGAAALAAVADYVVNASLVATFMSIKLRMPLGRTIRQLTIGGGREFLVSYLGLGVLGLTLALMFQKVGPWMLPAVFAPLIFARQVFYRSRALEEAHVQLQEREEILRELSNKMAEERADERLSIAGYLHDDLAQVLFRLSLQVDIARKMLDKEDLEELKSQLEKIKDSKQETSDRIRALIRELTGPRSARRDWANPSSRSPTRLAATGYPVPPRRAGHRPPGTDRATDRCGQGDVLHIVVEPDTGLSADLVREGLEGLGQSRRAERRAVQSPTDQRADAVGGFLFGVLDLLELRLELLEIVFVEHLACDVDLEGESEQNLCKVVVEVTGDLEPLVRVQLRHRV